MRHAGAMSQLPGPVRATLGLVVVAVDTARTLPDRVVELPVRVVSTALQASLRAQQRYAELTMRGDELLERWRGVPEEPPEWATFDEPPSTDGKAGAPTPVPPAEPATPSSKPVTPPRGTAKKTSAPRATGPTPE
jgi:hypothetical protein